MEHSGRLFLLQELPHSGFVLPYKGSKVSIVIFTIRYSYVDGKRIYIYIYICPSPLHTSLLLIITKCMTATQVRRSKEVTQSFYGQSYLKEIYPYILLWHFYCFSKLLILYLVQIDMQFGLLFFKEIAHFFILHSF